MDRFFPIKTIPEPTLLGSICNYYGGVDLSPRNEYFRKKAEQQNKFYSKLSGWGYKIITKPIKFIQTNTGIIAKCDMDIDIALDMIDNVHHNIVDMVIIFSGDSDYLSCLERIHRQGKYIRIFAFKNRLAWELRNFAIKNPGCHFTLLDTIREHIEFKSTQLDTK